ncbi:MAG: hypothetical protein ACRYG6_09740 [Janthinobacterium lividum]
MATGTMPGLEAQLPPLLSPSDAARDTASRFPAVPRWPERSSREGAPGTASTPARGAPYLGPCRRVRGQRTTAATLAATAAPGPSPAAGEPDRLAQALEGLRTALAQQARTVAAWRVSLAALEGAVGSLRLGLTRQAGSMQELEAQVSRLGAPASLQTPPGPR